MRCVGTAAILDICTASAHGFLAAKPQKLRQIYYLQRDSNKEERNVVSRFFLTCLSLSARDRLVSTFQAVLQLLSLERHGQKLCINLLRQPSGAKAIFLDNSSDRFGQFIDQHAPVVHLSWASKMKSKDSWGRSCSQMQPIHLRKKII